MYLIVPSKTYEKSLKKLKESGKLKKAAKENLEFAINTLAEGKDLPKEYSDHSLTGEMKGYRDCHIKGNLVLVYKIQKQQLILFLVDIGSHNQVFGE